MKNIKFFLILFSFIFLSLVSCPQKQDGIKGDCIIFSSSNKFTLKVKTKPEAKPWDGKLFVSVSKDKKKEWNGEEVYSYKDGNKYFIKVSGDGNHTITAFDSNNAWILSYTQENITPDIEIEGKLSSLTGDVELSKGAFSYLFYAPDATNKTIISAPVIDFKELPDNCFESSFKNCISLKNCPKIMCNSLGKSAFYEAFADCSSLESVDDGLNSSSIDEKSYMYMFNRCTELKELPSFLTTVLLKPQSCVGMFSNCPKIFISESNEDDYSDYINTYFIPSLDESVDDSNFPCDGMFENTGNNEFDLADIYALDGDEGFGIDYYTKNTVIE